MREAQQTAGVEGPVLLCADIGTSSLKAALIDAGGHERAFARVAYSQEKLSQRTVEAADWERALALALARIFSEAPALSLGAICISGNGPTLVPVTAGGDVLPPLHWYDSRRFEENSGLPREGASFFLPHVAWLREKMPGQYEKTACFFSPQDWLLHRLGAEPFTTLPSAAYVPYYWDEAQFRLFAIDREKFPPFAPMGSIAGRVSGDAASRFGLASGLPLVAGGPDFITALIGAGVLEPGMVCDRAGTSEGINFCAPSPVSVPELRVLPHAVEGLWNISVILSSSGSLFEWFRTFSGQRDRAYDEFLREITGPPEEGGDWFFPGTNFPEKLSAASSAPPCPGVLIAPSGLTTQVRFGRAVVEAIGFMVRDALDTLERYGFSVTEMRLSGGQGKNSRWNQLKADISGCTLLVPEIADGELAGNAILGMTALGESSGLHEAADRMIRIKARYDPNPKSVLVYKERLQKYRELREKLRSFSL
jgi:xylulokinase